MIPKLVGLALGGVGVIFTAGLAVGRWTQAHLGESGAALARPAVVAPGPGESRGRAVIDTVTTAGRLGRWQSSDQWELQLARLAAGEWPAVMAAVDRLEAVAVRATLRDSCVRRWAAADPTAAFAWVTEHRSEIGAAKWLENVLDVWAAHDPAAAVDALRRWPEPGGRRGVALAVARRMLHCDPAAALALLQAEGAGLSADAVRALFRSWDGDDPGAALAVVDTLAGAGREAGRQAIVFGWGQQDPEAALAWVRDNASGQEGAVLRRSALFGWAERDPVAAVADVYRLPAGLERNDLLPAMVGRWLERDPVAALRWCGSHPDTTIHPGLFWRALEGLPESEFGRFLAVARTLPEGPVRRLVVTRTIARFARISPDAALAWVRSLPAGPERDGVLGEALEAVARDNAGKALAQTATLPDEVRREVIAAAVRGAMERDPVEALALVEALPAGAQRNNLLEQTVRALGRQEPQDAIDYAISLPAGALRSELLRVAAGTFAERQPQAALGWLLTLPHGPERRNAARAVLREICDDPTGDSRRLAEAALELPDSDRGMVFNRLGSRLARGNPRAAATWALQLGDTRARRAAVAGVAEAWPAEDVSGALAMARSCPNAEERTSFVRAYAGQLARGEAGRVAAVVAQLPAGPDRDAMVQGVLPALMRSPQNAAACVDLLPPGPERVAAAQNVIRNLADSDPAAAARWMTRLPAAEQEQCVGFVVEAWGCSDAGAAVNWVNALPVGAGRNAAVMALIDGAYDDTPEIGSQWVAQIADPALRRQAIERVGRRWLAFDRAAAASWLRQSELPVERREALISGKAEPTEADELISFDGCVILD